MKVFVLNVQWKDGDPETAGVFSSIEKAASYFVRTQYRDADLPVPRLLAAAVHDALKLARATGDEDFCDFGNVRAWVDEHETDERCEAFEKGEEDASDD